MKLLKKEDEMVRGYKPYNDPLNELLPLFSAQG